MTMARMRVSPPATTPGPAGGGVQGLTQAFAQGRARTPVRDRPGQPEHRGKLSAPSPAARPGPAQLLEEHRAEELVDHVPDR